MTSESSPSSLSYSWRPATELLRLDPSTLLKEGEGNTLQLAKDEDYASAIVKSWRDERDTRTSNGGDGGSVASPFVYHCKTDGSPLYGHICRPSPPLSINAAEENYLPGVVLFHTGAGPQDIFLRWKADSLVNEHVVGERGCVVLIADILGDPTGWAWRDREKYDNIRKSILVPDDKGERKTLRGRVQAAIDAIKAQPGVDAERIGALGFCLGGHPVMELARMKDPSVKAMVTFHGVFDGVRRLTTVESGPTKEGDDASPADNGNVLVCTGEDDPFISKEDLYAAIAMFNDFGYKSNMITFEGTRHGFTNPAQDYNPSEAFAYNQDSYSKSWSAALSLLKSM